MTPAARLRAIADTLEAGDPLPATLAQWLAGAVRQYLHGAADGVTLDQCLGVATAQNHRPWWITERLHERDDLLRALHCQHFGELPPEQAAREIATAARGYLTGRWRHDQGKPAADVLPAMEGTPRALLFRAAQAADGDIPGSTRQIRRILSVDITKPFPCPSSDGVLEP